MTILRPLMNLEARGIVPSEEFIQIQNSTAKRMGLCLAAGNVRSDKKTQMPPQKLWEALSGEQTFSGSRSLRVFEPKAESPGSYWGRRGVGRGSGEREQTEPAGRVGGDFRSPQRLVAFSQLTSISSGSRVILCMGRMRKEIMGRFRQSRWPSILVSTSLKTAFLELRTTRVRESSKNPLDRRAG